MVKKYVRMTTTQLLDYMRVFKFKRKITQLHIHHTYLPNKKDFNGNNYDEIQYGMEKYHKEVKKWSNIAQHLTLFPDGIWVLGRDFNEIPASILGWNSGAICIEMLGDFDKNKETLVNPQASSVYEFSEYMVENMGVVMRFHRDSPTSYKTCPGSGIDREKFFDSVVNFTENKTKQKREELKRIMSEVKTVFNDMVYPNGKVHWSNDVVNKGVELGIVKGTKNSDGSLSFRPDSPLTRAEGVTLIMKLYESLLEEIKKLDK
jgi:hypothetical protein